MTLKDIFDKPVDRPIEGVIKADDEASLRVELEEYVLTNEVEKRLESFLDAYNKYEGANGVWVSGFFGSGKSHLLKMLALLLENREVDGASALELFLPKCGNNEILRGDLRKAVGIPSKSILFNIDQKADVISKTQIDALLAVFVKVFDEMCGYYGKHGHIAQFERDLDSRGLYADFKSAYETIAGRSWQKGREQALLESKNIADAYAKVAGVDKDAAQGILNKYRDQYRVSIEDFAEQINAYLERQPSNFRLNFFVDEVGQYIADNVKLMTNLQTIAESLATKCRGRAWVIVTAQEDMGTVVGEMGKQQGNDFSKIQARFANRMKLTSADVAEVIQKRLLLKNDVGVATLSELYEAQYNNFKTLFDFADGSQTYRNFQDQDHFVQSYPFIPYQFALFQSAIQNLSQHNAFEGKHSSVGERSMLGVFQQVAIQIGSHEVGDLATFDLMFEGIRTALKSMIQRSITQAEKHLESPFALKLLKALFLVKYVKEFKPTLRNLCVLMQGSFHEDLPGLKKRVEEALSLLEQQTYIQRNGDLFEFLTDEEKDVEQEIKNTEVESTSVEAELEKIVFESVIKARKIRYEENGQDYLFSRKLDDQLRGREQELTIHVISPFHEHAENESTLQMQSMGRDELLVVMPADERLVRDLLMYKRTEKYIRHNTSITQRDEVKRILTEKGFQNQTRLADLQQRVQRLMGQAKIFVAGTAMESNSEEAMTRIQRGFQELVTRTYPNLRMLRGVTYTENDLPKHLKRAGDGLFGNDATTLAESEQELLAFISSNHRGGVRTSLKTVLEKFERKPYGWSYAAVLCTFASLCARGKVEVRTDSNLLEEAELEQALRNSSGHGKVLIEPQVEFTASQVRALKEFYGDFFDAPPGANEAKALGKETGAAIAELANQLTPLVAQAGQYPFLAALGPALATLQELSGKPYAWYLTELQKQEEALFDLKEQVLDPIRKFMSGPQKGIFDAARKFVQSQEANFAYVEGEEAERIVACLQDTKCFRGDRMQQVKADIDALKAKVAAKLDAERTLATNAVANLKARLCGMAEFKSLEASQQAELTQPFDAFEATLGQQKLIAVLSDAVRRFEEKDFERLLSQMAAWASAAAEPKAAPTPAKALADAEGQGPSAPGSGDVGSGDVGSGAGSDVAVSDVGASVSASATTAPAAAAPGAPPAKPAPAPVEFVSTRSLKVDFDKVWLADEGDVDAYLQAMREVMLAEIRQGKKVRL